MYKAVDLRNKENLIKIADKPGYYKWWADKGTFCLLLKRLDGNFDEVISSIEVKEGLYAIYVGQATKESLRRRINWHINQKHTEKDVTSGYLSTLRKSISSIVANNQYDKEATNDLIDKLCVEVFECDYEIRSKEAKENIHKIEKNLINSHLYILNIQENHHPLSKSLKQKLRKLRKESKKQK